MTDNIKELVKRLTATRTQRDLNWNDVTYPINPDGKDAADALEAMAAEIERLKAGGCARGQRTTQWCAEASDMRAERDRLKGTLNYLKVQAENGTLHNQVVIQNARKALGDAS